MAQANTIDTMNGLFKETYAPKLAQVVPECGILQKRLKMIPADESPGKTFNQPVRLTRAHGWTLNGTSGGAYALNDAEAAQSKNASVVGSSFTMEERIGYDEVARLLKGEGNAQKRAFVSGSQYMIQNMMETAAFVGELQGLHGQENVGIIEAVNDNADGTADITISKASHIAAMWAGLENGYIDIYDTTEATKRNAAGTIQVTSYDFANRKVYIQGTISELATISASADVVYLRGTKTQGMVGLNKIASNATTLFGIDGSATGFALFSGNTHSAGSAPLIFSKMLRALNKPSQKAGLMGEITALVAPMTWTDVMNDLAALRRYADRAGGSIEQGASALRFHTHTGSVELVPHLFQKPGQATLYPSNDVKWIGPYDTTFKLPGSNDNFFYQLPSNAGYGVRCYWNKALFSTCPAKMVQITNIVNSDDA